MVRKCTIGSLVDIINGKIVERNNSSNIHIGKVNFCNEPFNKYRVVQKKSCMFESSRPLSAR